MESAGEIKRLSKMATRVFKHWTPTLAVYAVGAGLIGLYVTDWKVINTKIPYYGKKFDEENNI